MKTLATWKAVVCPVSDQCRFEQGNLLKRLDRLLFTESNTEKTKKNISPSNDQNHNYTHGITHDSSKNINKTWIDKVILDQCTKITNDA